MILTVRPATLADAEYIAQHLRAEDRREVETATGRAASAVLPESLRLSAECYTVRKDPAGEPCVIFGVARTAYQNFWAVWLLATNDLTGANLALIREARYWIDHWVQKYGGLGNRADLRNTLHLRWLGLMDFTLGPVEDGFQYFYRMKNHV